MGKITIKGGAYNRQNLHKKDKNYLVDQCLGLNERTEFLSKRIRELERLLSVSKKVQTWIHAHPRKATIVRSVIDEFDEAIEKALHKTEKERL